MHNDQSFLLSAAPCPEKGVALAQDLLCALIPGLLLLKQQELWQPSCGVLMIASKPSTLPKRKYLYSKDDNDKHYNRPDKSNTVLATFSTPTAKKGKHTHK